MPRQDDPQIGLSKAIRRLRKREQLSQEALGLACGIHPTWISHVESGRVNPTWGNVRRIAYGLRVPLPVLAALAEDLERKFAPPQGEADRAPCHSRFPGK
jgi:transcriptional regulator with XRE-family HTH domain